MTHFKQSRESRVSLLSQLSLCSALFHPENAYEYVRFFPMTPTHFHQLKRELSALQSRRTLRRSLDKIVKVSNNFFFTNQRQTKTSKSASYIHLHCKSSYSQNILSFYH
jgi:hypothetical protein